MSLLIGFFSCKPKMKEQSSKDKQVFVDVIIAGIEDFPNNIEVNGTVLSEEMIELHPEISGRLTYLNIPDGGRVKKGTILAKINDADLQAQLEQQKIQLDLAVKTEQRLKKLLAVNGVNQSDYDAALSQVHIFQSTINVLNAQIDKTIIRASFDGVLGLRLVSVGAYVTPQTLIGTLLQNEQVKIDFTIPEVYADFVHIGNTISIQTNGSKEIYPANIVAVEPLINTTTRNLKVRARLNTGNLNPGAFVKVLLNEKAKGIIVPTNAIIPDAMSNQIVVIKNGKAQFVNVETGVRTADVVELSSGVHAKDTIVVSGVLFVRPNAIVKIRKVRKVYDTPNKK